MTKAEEHELAQKERGEELNALATAKKILEEKTGASECLSVSVGFGVGVAHLSSGPHS